MSNENDPKKGRDSFSLQSKTAKWAGGEIVMTEPTLADGLELADSYFDMVVDTSPGKGNKMKVTIRESEYIRAICLRYFSPAIDVSALPMRLYKEVRRLVDIWEEFSGMGAVRETMASQVSENE